jgi:hypothetical protein
MKLNPGRHPTTMKKLALHKSMDDCTERPKETVFNNTSDSLNQSIPKTALSFGFFGLLVVIVKV